MINRNQRFGSVALMVVLTCVPGMGAKMPADRLPQPSGQFGIGRVGFDWVDGGRPAACPGQAATETQAHREMMVYLWYPSARRRPDAQGAYVPLGGKMEAQSSVRNLARDEFGATWPLMLSGAIYSHAIDGASVAKSRQDFPVILFSPGAGSSQFSYTALIEDLVSHGFVVAGIEHPCSAGIVAFPDGRVVIRHNEGMPAGLSPEKMLQRMMAAAMNGIAEGAADDRFVLDQLARLSESGSGFPLAGRLDLNRVAAMGHSAGGSIAARACQLDRRIRACIDMEGQLIPVEAIPEFPDHAKNQQPLLLMEVARSESEMGGTYQEHEAYFRKREQQLQELAAGSYDVIVRAPGLHHSSFSDGPMLNAAVDSPDDRIAKHNLAIVERIVRAFLNDTLENAAEPLIRLVPGADAEVRPIGKGTN